MTHLTEVPLLVNLTADMKEDLILVTWEPLLYSYNCNLMYLVSYENRTVSLNRNETSFTIPFATCHSVLIEVSPVIGNGHLGVPSSVVFPRMFHIHISFQFYFEIGIYFF